MTAVPAKKTLDLEILEPGTRKHVGDVWVTDEGIFVSSQDLEFKSHFEEVLAQILVGQNQLSGTKFRERAILEVTISPHESGYIPALSLAVGDYLIFDRKTELTI